MCVEGASAPQLCRKGTHADSDVLLAVGYLSNLTRDCKVCPRGTSCASGSDAPTPCRPSTYNAQPGKERCDECSAGSFQNDTSATACRDCPVGSFCPDGTAQPINCVTGAGLDHARTLTNGATSAADCRCEAGYYDNRAALHGAINCTACPSGTSCTEAGHTLQSVPILRGYYRRSLTSTDIKRCPDAGVNCTESPVCAESASGCVGSFGVAATMLNTSESGRRRLQSVYSNGCNTNLTGVFCRLCEQSWTCLNGQCEAADDSVGSRYFYSAARWEIGSGGEAARCIECRSETFDAILAAIVTVVVALIAWVACRQGFRALPSSRRKQFRVAWQRFTPHNKLKIIIAFYMVAVKVDDVYEVEVPAEVRFLLSRFKIAFGFGLEGVDPVLQCLGISGFRNKLLVYMLAPFAAIVVALVGLTARVLCQGRSVLVALVEGFAQWSLIILFVTYPIVTTTAFDAFSCYHFEDGRSFLKKDVSIECRTPAHDDVISLSSLAIAIYPVGTWLLNAALLFFARKAITSRKPSPLSRSIAFLFREYKPELFWWELVEMSRRLVLIGVMVLYQDRMMQLLAGTLLTTVFLLLCVQAAPYEELADSYLASVTSFSLVVLFVCCVAFKYQQLPSLPEISVRLSPEQQTLYVLDIDTLVLVITASVVGTLIFTLTLFGVQFAAEGRRLRRERLANRARRLRSRNDDTMIEAPPISEDSYHLFLSHVWGTGQDQMRIIKQRLLEMLPELQVFLDVDDLKEIGDLEGYIERSGTVLVYCSVGYFTSRNCMRELVTAALHSKPVIALIDPESVHGGLSLAEIRTKIATANDTLFEKWGLQVAFDRGEALYEHLFTQEPIEWNRIGHFQDVTMRLIAERLLPTELHRATTIDNEIASHANEPRPMKKPGGKSRFHIYASPLNPGALELVEEVASERGMQLNAPSSVLVTTEPALLGASEHFLLYLTAQTWTRGKASEELADEVTRAMDLGMNMLLAHEMPGVGGQAARHGCEFGAFFSNPDGATPNSLLKRGIYSKIAIPLKGGEWRTASLAIMGWELSMSREQAEAAASAAATTAQVNLFNKLGTTSLAPSRLVLKSGRLTASLVRSTWSAPWSSRVLSAETKTQIVDGGPKLVSMEANGGTSLKLDASAVELYTEPVTATEEAPPVEVRGEQVQVRVASSP